MKLLKGKHTDITKSSKGILIETATDIIFLSNDDIKKIREVSDS